MNVGFEVGVWCGTVLAGIEFFCRRRPSGCCVDLLQTRQLAKDVRHFAWIVSFPPLPALNRFRSNLGAQCRRSDQVMRQCIPQRYCFYFSQATDKQQFPACRIPPERVTFCRAFRKRCH